MTGLRRREFVQGMATLALLAGCKVVSTPSSPPTPEIARVGLLGVGRPVSGVSPNTSAFVQGLRELGYEEGRNLILESRWTTQQEDFLPLATEILQAGVAVVVAVAMQAIQAVRQASATIPIVMVYSGDPVTSGLVPSLARPGGNITGLSSMDSQLSGKRVELLKDAVRDLSHLAVLWNPAVPDKSIDFQETRVAAQRLGLQILSLEVQSPDEIDSAFTTAKERGANGLIVLLDDLMFQERSRIAAREIAEGLPGMYAIRQHVTAGGLMAYGPDTPTMFRRAAYYVDRILKGTKPADLPVEQPMRFSLVVNLKTARAFGLDIPASVLLDATEIIE
jgi:putative tryptophan/tyrosine transport system substrate-binding protein